MISNQVEGNIETEFTDEVVASIGGRRTISGIFYNPLFACRVCRNTGIGQNYDLQTVKRTPRNGVLGNKPIIFTREVSVSYFCKTCEIQTPEMEGIIVPLS